MTLLRDLLSTQQPLVTVAPNATVREAAKKMASANVGSVAVMENERLAGIFTERDLLQRVLAEDLDLDATPIGAVMTKDVVTSEVDLGTGNAIHLMRRHNVRHLPVVSEAGSILGMFSIRDLLRAEMQDLRDYIARSEG